MPTGVDIVIESGQTAAMTIYVDAYYDLDPFTVVGSYDIEVTEVIDCLDSYLDLAAAD